MAFKRSSVRSRSAPPFIFNSLPALTIGLYPVDCANFVLIVFPLRVQSSKSTAFALCAGARCEYRKVIVMSLWPKSSWMVRKSPPPESKCVAKLCLSACGVALSGRPSAERSEKTHAVCEASSRREGTREGRGPGAWSAIAKGDQTQSSTRVSRWIFGES